MANVEVKKLTPVDIDQFIELIHVFEEVFEMKSFRLPNIGHLQTLLQKDLFFVFVAIANRKVVGGLTAYTLEQYYSELPVVYIYDLAVKTALQRSGIGTSLVSALTAYCKECGVQEVFVQADVADGYALDFYRSTGATSEDVVHFTYLLHEAKGSNQ